MEKKALLGIGLVVGVFVLVAVVNLLRDTKKSFEDLGRRRSPWE